MVGKILIVDDVATNRIVFKVKLGAACYRPLMAADGASCLRLAREERPDLVLLDLMLPDMPGIEVLRALRADPVTADVPVVVISATGAPAQRIEAFEAGADDFLIKPIDDSLLLARLRNLMRAHESLAELGARGATLQALGLAERGTPFVPLGRVALVTDRPEIAILWRKDLQGVLPDHLMTLTRAEALAAGTDEPSAPADVFVIDADSAGTGSGLQMMSELRSRQPTRHAAVMLVQTAHNPDQMAMAFDMGASDVVEQGISPVEMGLRLKALIRRKRRGDALRASVQDGLRLAVIDPLTGLYNRRYALPRLAAIADRADAVQGAFAVMVIDIDRFKLVNDQYGHAAGDAVLVEVAQRVTENLRASDLVARIGGEEFLVALPSAALAQARATAERLCRAIAAQPFLLPDGSNIPVTISIGLAVCDNAADCPGEPVAGLVERADRALMDSKAGGRNKVTVSGSAAA